MKDTHALPPDFVREIYAALAGTTVADFDAEDFSSTLPATVTVSAFFGTSHCPTDVQQAVNSAFPYPAGTQRVDALVVVRGNGLDVSRLSAIQDALHRKVPGSLFISVSKSSTLPPGTAAILLLALSHNKAKKMPPPFLKLVVQDEAQHDSGE